MTAPVRFCFGVHLHQPVGNFGYVFEQHVRDVYLPFLSRLREREFFPVTLHVSGPLLEWLDQHDRRVLDVLGDLASRGQVELLLAGFYEPVLAALPRLDRLDQIAWMRGALRTRFGVEAKGLWLTERVWEPDLAADLFDAGVRFVLVDDRHFLVSGLARDRLRAPFWTEHDGKGVALFPIDEKLRYLIPFQPPEETVSYLRGLRERGHALAVLADDGEKFGGWPGTREWVYDRGWLDRFVTVMREEIDRGQVTLSTFADALEKVPSGGVAYLPTASYREMEGWALPADAALRLAAFERELGPDRLTGPEGVLLRGSHWRNFMVKYPESNRMHKKMLAVSFLSRQQGDPPTVRRLIGRAQCNDVYWHGVFGGLYLPFLRVAVWENLARAEQLLREGEPLACEEVDIDYDGHIELWIHSAEFSAIVSPARGGAIEELTWFSAGINLANTLTRRREVYHIEAEREVRDAAVQHGTPARSRHAADQRPPSNEGGAVLADSAPEGSGHRPAAASTMVDTAGQPTAPSPQLLPVDLDTRAIFIERIIPERVTRESYESASYTPLVTASSIPMSYSIDASADRVEIRLRSTDDRLSKELSFSPRGAVGARFAWDPASFAVSGWFTTELSFDQAHPFSVTGDAEIWSHAIETVAKSERGFDRTLQGVAYLVRWSVGIGHAEVEIPAGVASRTDAASGVPEVDTRR